MILENIENGKAYKKFLELVRNQEGDISYIENLEKLQKAKYILPVISNSNGYVQSINAEQVGKLSSYLGAGRIRKEDIIDKDVGIIVNKKVGDQVQAGDILGYIHANDEQKGETAVKQLLEIYTIIENKVEKQKHIIKIV